MVFKPFLGPFGGVLGVIILLEDEVAGVEVIVFQSLEDMILRNLSIELCIHLAFYPAHQTHTSSCHAAPNHNIPSTKSNGLQYMLRLEGSTCSFQHHYLPSDPIWLILVSSVNITHAQSPSVQCLYLSA